MIEIYSNRLEVTNPGEPLVDTDRFLDTLQNLEMKYLHHL